MKAKNIVKSLFGVVLCVVLSFPILSIFVYAEGETSDHWNEVLYESAAAYYLREPESAGEKLARHFADPEFSEAYAELEDGKLQSVGIFLNGGRLVPEFDFSLLTNEYRLNWDIITGKEPDPMADFYTEAFRRAIPVLEEYMAVSEAAKNLPLHYQWVIGGMTTKENIIKLISLDFVDRVYIDNAVWVNETDGSPAMGDVDGDGFVNARDARLALHISAGLESGTDVDMKADVNEDGKVTAADARKILRVSAGLETF